MINNMYYVSASVGSLLAISIVKLTHVDTKDLPLHCPVLVSPLTLATTMSTFACKSHSQVSYQGLILLCTSLSFSTMFKTSPSITLLLPLNFTPVYFSAITRIIYKLFLSFPVSILFNFSHSFISPTSLP